MNQNENHTGPEEVNSDKDDDIDSFFTVQNLTTATVSALEQLNSYLQQPVWDVSHSACFHS